MNLKNFTTYLIRHPMAAALFIFCVVAISNLWVLGDGPLAKTEGVRVLTGHQMHQNDQWLIPHLYGSVYLTKPPMYYWVIGLIEKITGQENEWIWRLPSAMGSALLAVFLWGMARRWFGATAGLVTGLSYLLLLTLWTQNRSAEIDALNNAASILCACGILELGIGRKSHNRWVWAGLIGFSLAAALLMKGPAGLPVVIGAMVGIAVANRKLSALKSLPLWSGIFLGVGLFMLWAVLMQRQLAVVDTGMDTSGLQEVAYRLNPANLLEDGLEIITLPVVLMAYSFPVSIALIICLLPAVCKQFDEETYLRIKGITGGTFAALGICILSLISNPRYGYMIPPMFCLSAGIVVMAWERGYLSERLIRIIVGVIKFTALIVVSVQVAMIVQVWPSSTSAHPVLVITSVLLLISLWFIFRLLKQQQYGHAGLVLVGMCVLLSFSFNEYMTRKRCRQSGLNAGTMLKEWVGTNTLIHAETMVRYHPEIFYYADVRVQRHSEMIDESYTPESSGWYVLHEWEWTAWAPTVSNHLSRIKQLPEPDEATVCWFELP